MRGLFLALGIISISVLFFILILGATGAFVNAKCLRVHELTGLPVKVEGVTCYIEEAGGWIKLEDSTTGKVFK